MAKTPVAKATEQAEAAAAEKPAVVPDEFAGNLNNYKAALRKALRTGDEKLIAEVKASMPGADDILAGHTDPMTGVPSVAGPATVADAERRASASSGNGGGAPQTGWGKNV